MKVSENTLKKIKIYSDRLGKRYEELYNNYFDILEELEIKYPKAKNIEEKALIKLRRLIREIDKTIIPSPAVMFKGFKIGDSGVKDIVQMRIQKVLRMDREIALKQGKIDEEGNPIDLRPKCWIDGKYTDNPNYGFPYTGDEHSYLRTEYFIASKNNENIFKITHLTSYEDMALKERKLDYFVPVTFRANIKRKESDDTIYNLNYSKVTEFNPINEEWNIPEIVNNVKNEIWTLDKLEQAYDLVGEDWKSPILIKAEVRNMDLRVTRYGNRTIYLDCEERFLDKRETVRCYIPEHIPITFHEDDKIIILGCLTMKTLGEKEVIIINAYGYCPTELMYE